MEAHTGPGRLTIVFVSLLAVMLTLGACSSEAKAPAVLRVADDPKVDSAEELGALLAEGTITCLDFETPITVQMPGISRGVCTFTGSQVSITVFTDGRRIGTRPDRTRLIGTNWTIDGPEDVLLIAQQAIGGELVP